MPDLNSWIQEQLKKGYKVGDIKSSLLRKGYSSTSIAKVDNINQINSGKQVSNNQIKKINAKIIIPIALIVVIIIAFILLPGKLGLNVIGNKGDKILQPDSVITFVGNIPGERYNGGGIITDLSPTSLTIKKGSKSKSFRLSVDDPADFFKANDLGYERVDSPQVGDEFSRINLIYIINLSNTC